MFRSKKQLLRVCPKIFIWSHTKKAEIEYFQDFKHCLRTPLIQPEKYICGTPQELIRYIIQWKKKEIDEKDKDQVWCIFDVDDFYKNGKVDFLKAITEAKRNNIKIAYANECFELWILLHFKKINSPIYNRGTIEKEIQKVFKKNALGNFNKNQKVFKALLPFQLKAIQNAKKLITGDYDEIDFDKMLSSEGNPSTSIHFLVEEINKKFGVKV